MLATENRSTVLHNLFLVDMSIFSEFIIKNDPVKKATSFLVFMKGVQLLHDQVLVLEDKTFHCKVFIRLYPNNRFNILANFDLVVSTS